MPSSLTAMPSVYARAVPVGRRSDAAHRRVGWRLLRQRAPATSTTSAGGCLPSAVSKSQPSLLVGSKNQPLLAWPLTHACTAAVRSTVRGSAAGFAGRTAPVTGSLAGAWYVVP